MKGVKYRIINPGSTGTNYLTSSQVTSREFGISPKIAAGDASFIFTSSGDPSKIVYFHIKHGPLNYGTYTGATQYMLNVKITYYIKCFNLLDISQS